MRDILGELTSWWAAGEPAAVATVIDIWKSAPRQPGAAMAVAVNGTVVGSVSGGCVEGAVYEIAMEVLSSGETRRVRFGVTDDDALAVGLTCGGEIDLVVQRIAPDSSPSMTAVTHSIETEEPVAVAMVVGGETLGNSMAFWSDRSDGTLGDPGLDASILRDGRGMLEAGMTGLCTYGPSGEQRLDDVEVFVRSFAARPRMLVFGAIDFAASVVRIGRFLGYHVTLCDARGVFATPKRFPDADEVVVEWPNRFLKGIEVDARTAICVLTHDPKFDIPVLEIALRSSAGYIGAMGSRRTHEDRLERLRELGLTEEELARLHSPIGLDLGARTPAETAVSIAAELIQVKWGGSGLPLTKTQGRIHSED